MYHFASVVLLLGLKEKKEQHIAVSGTGILKLVIRKKMSQKMQCFLVAS